MKKFIRKILFGDTPVREYATVTVQGDIRERVYFEADDNRKDVSANHWLLCLNPVIFGIWFERKEGSAFLKEKQGYKILFYDAAKDGKIVAVLRLEFFNKIEEEGGTLYLLKLIKQKIYHINFIKLRLLFYRYYKKPEQDFDILKSYAAAYSYPRKVRIVSFKEGDQFNIFPMDLVGDISKNKRFVFGLRHTNVTLARIIETKKMVVSEVPYEYKDIIYQLGKHHSEPLSKNSLPFKLIQSEIYGFPLPEWANSYKEIRLLNSMSLGSHMLLWGEVINEKPLTESKGHLFHIHFLHYLHLKQRGSAYMVV